MNPKVDPRHQSRLETVQNLYAYSFNEKNILFPNKLDEKTIEVIKKKDNLDKQIASFAPRFPIDKISKIDLAILRLAFFELTNEKREPPKVIVNEAVELAKELGGEKSYSFINGVLGKMISL
jgi:N utilization substance protein B